MLTEIEMAPYRALWEMVLIRAIKDLKRKKTRLQQLQRNQAIGWFYRDEEECNSFNNICELLGLPQDELIGSLIKKGLLPDREEIF